MNYFNKYLKYKKKYLQLKAGYFNFDYNIKNNTHYDIDKNEFIFDNNSIDYLFPIYNFEFIYKNCNLINNNNYFIINKDSNEEFYKINYFFQLENYEPDIMHEDSNIIYDDLNEIIIRKDYDMKPNKFNYLFHKNNDYLENVMSYNSNYLYNYRNYYCDEYLNILIDKIFYNEINTTNYKERIDSNLIHKFMYIGKYNYIYELLFNNINSNNLVDINNGNKKEINERKNIFQQLSNTINEVIKKEEKELSYL